MSEVASKTILRSLSEIAAMAEKAARGAGYSWAMAQEAGTLTRTLESYAMPGVCSLAALLRSWSEENASGVEEPVQSGLHAAVDLADQLTVPGSTDPIRFGPVQSPLLLVGSLLLVASSSNRSFKILWAKNNMNIHPESIDKNSFSELSDNYAKAVSIQQCPSGRGDQTVSHLGRAVNVQSWQYLESLAARTLVPETETSRARGAGPAN